MGRSSNQVHEDNGDLLNFSYVRRNDLNCKVQFQKTRPSPFTTATSFPLLLPDKRGYWKRKFSSQPIGLSVLKLDGSTFDIIVTKKATVAKLKQAVEAAFSHVPRQGDSKISWSYVWEYFCLCFEHMKLLRDRDPIARYGIKNGDQVFIEQLQFVRHTPVYTVAGERSWDLPYSPHDSEGSSSSISDFSGDMKNMPNLVKNEVSEGYKCYGDSKKSRSDLVYTMRGFLSHGRKEGLRKRYDRVVRLGQPLPSDDDADSNEGRDTSCRLDGYPSNSFSDYVGGFGYPTGYCLK